MECESRLREAASKKILIEVALLKAAQARNAVPIDTVLKKLQALRDGTANGDHTSQTARPRAAVAPQVPEAAPQAAGRASTTLPGLAESGALGGAAPVSSPKSMEASTPPSDLEN